MRSSSIACTICLALSIASNSTAVHAGTILDLLKPHAGKAIMLSANNQLTTPTLVSVEADYFCVHPDRGGDVCYPAATIRKVVLRDKDKYPISVGLMLSPGESLPGPAL